MVGSGVGEQVGDISEEFAKLAVEIGAASRRTARLDVKEDLKAKVLQS